MNTKHLRVLLIFLLGLHLWKTGVTAQSPNINNVSANIVTYTTTYNTLYAGDICDLPVNTELSTRVASVITEIQNFRRFDDLAKDMKSSQSFLDLINLSPTIIKVWHKLAVAGREFLRKEKVPLEAFRDLIDDNKVKMLTTNTPGLEEIMAKMMSYNLGDNATDFATICRDVRTMINDALPEVSKIANISQFLGSSGFTNASAYARRHADLMLKKINDNGSFIKNADEITFELKEIVEGAPNAVADFDFIKDGKRYVGEIKAGDQVISSNFTSQMINYFGRVDDLRHVKSFRRDGVSLSKSAVVDHWVANGLVDNQNVKSLFEKYKGGVPFIDKDQFVKYLSDNNGWFDEIFNSNFN